MSVEALAVALHHTRTTNPTTKWVLAGIANHDGDGGSWPTIATLAKYALCSERTAQRAVAELVALGEVKVEAQAGGTRDWRGDRRPNLYRFLLACPPNCDRSQQHRLLAGTDTAHTHGVTAVSPREADGVTPVTERGDTGVADGVTPVSPKPSLEPSTEVGGALKRAHRLPEGWAPPADVVAQMRQECPRIDQNLELRKFRDHWRAQGGSKGAKLDWPATYRNWIRNSAPPRGQQVEPGYHQTDEQIRRERLAKAGDLIPPRGLTPAEEQRWLREARRRIADGLPLDDIGDAA